MRGERGERIRGWCRGGGREGGGARGRERNHQTRREVEIAGHTDRTNQ